MILSIFSQFKFGQVCKVLDMNRKLSKKNNTTSVKIVVGIFLIIICWVS